MPHAVPKLDARYHAGPHISGGVVRVHGYTAESERTFFLTEPDRELKQAFDAMREARRRAFAAAHPGAVCAEVDAAANDFLPNVGGLRHSDTVLITENGNESHTHYPDDFESMLIRGAEPFKRLMGAITRRVAGVA